MNRILLGLVCCSPLFFSVPVQSVELIGPNDEIQSPQQQTVEAIPASTASSVTQINTPTKYGPIKSSETLWSIATKLRPNNNVSVYQTLAAIYKSNPSAFRQGDINKIIESSVINIPSPALIAQQSNTEAYALLKPTPKVSQITKLEPKPRVITTVQPVQVDVPKKVETSFVPIDEPNTDLLKKDLEDKKLTLIRNELQVADQEKELELLNEQLIVATEANQRLKLKLQPLSDQITSLSEQVAEEVKVQKELQAIIDQYKAQIDAIEEPPFSGPGILNTILRVISSSTSMLIFAILFPLLLLTGIFLLILRLKSKRELALRQQELAESTAILSEEKSEFDTLLDDDLDIQPLSEEQEDSDFIVDVSTDEPETTLMDDSNAEDNGIEQSIVEENTDEQINEVEEVIDTELIDQGTSENEPEEINTNDLDFDIDAMIDGSDDVIDLSEADLNLEGTDQKDLDLAAQWESELAQAELEENNGVEQEITTESSADEIEEVDPTFSESEQEPIELDIPEESDEVTPDIDADVEAVTETVEDVATDLDADVEAVTETVEEVATDLDADVEAVTETVEEVATDLDAEVEAVTETVEEVAPDLDADVEAVTETVEEVAPDLDADVEAVSETVEEVTSDIDADVEAVTETVEEVTSDIDADVEAVTETVEDIATDLETDVEALSETADKDITSDIETDVEALSDDVEEVDADTLAKQLSSGAFNEDVALPSFDKNDDKGFIDIDTLLTGDEASDVTEEDFNLEFGLDEFPDVVDSFAEFDTDADGVAAQLDLAHAYLEIDEKEGAKDILTKLLESAPEDKLKEVKKLLARIS